VSEPVSTGSPELDKMLEGGFPTSSLVQLFGLKALGKSILSFQTAVKNVSQGRSSIIVDTELGYLNNVIPHWLKPFGERFGCDARVVKVGIQKTYDDAKKKRSSEAFLREAFSNVLRQVQVTPTDQELTDALNIFAPNLQLAAEKADEPCVYVIEAPSLVDLLSLHGLKVEILVSEGGRVEVRLQPHGLSDPKFSPLGRFVTERKASFVVYDSISAPMKAVFAGTQDLPARSSSLALLLGQVQRICNAIGVSVLAINHITVHPINPAWSHPYGGLIVGYDFKYVFHLEKAPSESKLEEVPLTNPGAKGDGNRLVWAYRHPRLEEYGSACLLRLDEDGFN
jgi:hypothetical protein